MRRTNVSPVLKTLLELGLIEYKSGKLSAVSSAAKTALTNSQTYSKLIERSGNNE